MSLRRVLDEVAQWIEKCKRMTGIFRTELEPVIKKVDVHMSLGRILQVQDPENKLAQSIVKLQEHEMDIQQGTGSTKITLKAALTLFNKKYNNG